MILHGSPKNESLYEKTRIILHCFDTRVIVINCFLRQF